MIQRFLFSLILLFLLALSPIPSNACSIFTAAKGDQVLAGANEDGDDPFGKLWLMPASDGRYGGVYFGLAFVDKQAGMNEHGLFFDFAALDPVITDFNEQGVFLYIEEIMATCKSVEEALAFLKEHSYAFNQAQLLLADATGNSVIVTPEKIISREGDYQIATNFNACRPQDKSTCQRYQRIERELAKAKAISTEQFRDLLQAVHMEGETNTLYSKVFDLKAKTVTIYNFHDYGRPVTIDLTTALSGGFRMEEIYDLFENHSFAEDRYRDHHPEVLANQLYRMLRSNEPVKEAITRLHVAKEVAQSDFEQQLTKAIIEAIIVERLAQDNYSIVHQFLPYPHAFYQQGWQSGSSVLERCQLATSYMQEEKMGFYYLAAGIPPEANMLPQIQGYLGMVMR
jgi:hypothetical protein